MGRNKLRIRKLENIVDRQALFAKRKNMIIKKAKELCILCDIDVGVIMFSPTNDLTIFSSSRTFEDLVIRSLTQSYRIKGPIGFKNEELLLSSMIRLKYEAEIMELFAEKEKLEKELEMQKQRLNKIQETNRLFNPYRYPLESIHQAEMSEKAITNELMRVKKWKEKLLKSHASYEATEGFELKNIAGDRMLEILNEMIPTPNSERVSEEFSETKPMLPRILFLVDCLTHQQMTKKTGMYLQLLRVISHA